MALRVRDVADFAKDVVERGLRSKLGLPAKKTAAKKVKSKTSTPRAASDDDEDEPRPKEDEMSPRKKSVDVEEDEENGGRADAAGEPTELEVKLSKVEKGIGNLAANVGQIRRGKTGMVVGSKFWGDVTARDDKGNELLDDDLIDQDLAFTQRVCVVNVGTGETVAEYRGKGALKNSRYVTKSGLLTAKPKAGYTLEGSAEIGVGQQATNTENGAVHQFKALRPADGNWYKFVVEAYGLTAESPAFRVGKATPKPRRH